MIHLQLNTDYYTNWGQQVCVCGSIPQLGSFDESKALQLSITDNTHWKANLLLDDLTESVDYYYFIREGNDTIRREWGDKRTLNLSGEKTFEVFDHWKDKPYHIYLYSSVFTESVFYHPIKVNKVDYNKCNYLLHVLCPFVKNDQQLLISGGCDVLGNWDLKKALPLDCVKEGEWQILLDTSKIEQQVAYKFVIVNSANKSGVRWEDGENRVLNLNDNNDSVYLEMAIPFRYYNYIWKGTGVSIPVFSLLSKESFGIGDFNDLKKMIDLAEITDQHIIQLLPVNDTTTTKTWKDSYPYSAISIFALHPIYLGLSKFKLDDAVKQKRYLRDASRLNKLKSVDYENVYKLKMDFVRDLFIQDREKVFADKSFIAFYERNEDWLFPYGCYCYLRDKNNSVHFGEWNEYAKYNRELLKKMLDNDMGAKDEYDLHIFTQYLLHEQLSAAKEYAHQKGVALKGDIPIGIDRESVDAWTNPHLFNMDTQSGAPPDDFSFTGQNWGFPTYNWRAMEVEKFNWWKKRFVKMADYFDAYRIDHILGFFRIWEIPVDAVQGLLGHFSPALPYFADEIMYSGIPFNENRMVKPFIHQDYLSDIFAEYTEEVIKEYLDISDFKLFALKPFCNTQIKIKHLFEGKSDDRSNRIRNGLYALCCEVLFVRDRVENKKFHPRITAQYTYSYKYLDDHVKVAFNKLYDDFYYNRHNYFWREEAMKKLPKLISSTNMMVCGEDLGMVPDCVPSVMNELQIISLEIERMPKKSNMFVADLNRLPYLSVCTTSTHDMSPIREWWQEDRHFTQRYFNDVLGHYGEAPVECTVEICKEIINRHLNSNSMWVILPLQDWLSIDSNVRNADPLAERINIPANPDHYWQYRMHVSLEELLKKKDLNAAIKNMSIRSF